MDKAANAQQKQETVKPAAQKSEQKPAQKPAAPKIAAVKVAEVVEPKQDSKVFQLSSEKKILSTPKVNVLGKIDLDSINQSTRPKKKSKEERRREREAKVSASTRTASTSMLLPTSKVMAKARKRRTASVADRSPQRSRRRM